MSDYYYFDDKDSEFGFIAVPGEDYIHALRSIAKKNGIKIDDEMILKEVELNRKNKKKVGI